VRHSNKAPAFGRLRNEHTIIIASGERIRHMTVRPWAMALAGCTVAALIAGYFLATTYLILRDDLIGASLARQARMQHVYEDRIAALRAQVDRVTSLQMLDQRMMEDKVEELMAHQAALTSRHGRLDAMLERAEQSLGPIAETPLPTPRPDPDGARRADAAGGGGARDALGAISLITERPAGPAAPSGALTAYASPGRDAGTDRLFMELRSSLDDIASQQMQRVRALASDAAGTADAIASILRGTGFDVPEEAETGIGGPYVASSGSGAFDATLGTLDVALDRLDTIREHAARLPLGNPAEGHAVSSRYGTRRDPFLRRAAFHAGMDFRVRQGEEVHATGSGTVVSAGRRGGYGKLVEIDHGDGVVTRYAHLSEILVTKGDAVGRGQAVGRAGSTGRSTGPHLHYEVRFDGDPVDPARFIAAGTSLEPLLASR
jgi:murein DD-endopeptidase MepM/ murein hydrolase activator NlpD